MANGIPVLASDRGALPETLGEGGVRLHDSRAVHAGPPGGADGPRRGAAVGWPTPGGTVRGLPSDDGRFRSGRSTITSALPVAFALPAPLGPARPPAPDHWASPRGSGPAGSSPRRPGATPPGPERLAPASTPGPSGDPAARSPRPAEAETGLGSHPGVLSQESPGLCRS